MLEKTTRMMTENLARGINRRSFLRRTGETTFTALAAMAAGHGMLRPASAATGGGKEPLPPQQRPQCAPPGPYCNLDGISMPTACRGGSCYQHRHNGVVYQCRVYYQWYQAGCWTTAVSGGYWTCCDCECGNPRVASCGCAQFSSAPVPRPDGGETSTSA